MTDNHEPQEIGDIDFNLPESTAEMVKWASERFRTSEAAARFLLILEKLMTDGRVIMAVEKEGRPWRRLSSLSLSSPLSGDNPERKLLLWRGVKIGEDDIY